MPYTEVFPVLIECTLDTPLAMRLIFYATIIQNSLFMKNYTRLPVTPLGRRVAVVRVTDPPTVMVMKDEGERRMEVDSTDILFMNN